MAEHRAGIRNPGPALLGGGYPGRLPAHVLAVRRSRVAAGQDRGAHSDRGGELPPDRVHTTVCPGYARVLVLRAGRALSGGGRRVVVWTTRLRWRARSRLHGRCV